MPKLRVLSADDILSILRTSGFEVVGQKGSHIKLSRTTSFEKQILTIPNHKTLAKGTIKAIFNQAGRFISHDELRQSFYTE